jgi:mutator protein MutT
VPTFDPESLRARLESGPCDPIPQTTLAGVLVPLIAGPDGWSIILTRRTRDLPNHRGEISFPGGKADPGETAQQAAVRETHEELGIAPSRISILGRLSCALTFVSRFSVEPWVAVVSGPEMAPNPREIEEVLLPSLETLADPSSRREQRVIRGGGIMVAHAYDLGPNIIWGATARILDALLNRIE